MLPIDVGFFSFTEITDPGEHHSYNEWHMLDHMPEQFPLPGVAWGQRWVSTPACRSARSVSAPPLDAIHYVTCYFMTEPLDETLRDFYALGRELARAGRFHQHRASHLSGPFSRDAIAAAPRVLVRPEAVPFRPHLGVYVVVAPAPVPVDALVECAGVAGAWSFTAAGERFAAHPWQPGPRAVTVAYLDDAPLTVAPKIDALVRVHDGVEFAGPFETITPWHWDWFD
ncbi:MAG TPA: hypothetical protein VFX21_09490 [Acidimicrobiia bacterium]|nr:hypothetical protein [Acidimicrobiia bacterium]